MSTNSCPEIDALVARVGLEQAMRTVRGWIGARDGEAFLRWSAQRPAPEALPAASHERVEPAAAPQEPAGLAATASQSQEPPAPGTEEDEAGGGLLATASGGLEGNACRCGANRGADCDCWEDYFREEDGGGLEATGSGGGGLLATASGGGAAEEAEEPREEDCALHGPMMKGGLWYSPNSFGYSTTSPPCNGCVAGQRDAAAGIWMSGFGAKRNVFHSDGSGPMKPLYPVEGGGAAK
jgi:hypothetical protein